MKVEERKNQKERAKSPWSETERRETHIMDEEVPPTLKLEKSIALAIGVFFIPTMNIFIQAIKAYSMNDARISNVSY